MKVLELEINNVRGIRHLLLKPEGNNFVIWGPNGSGKSAVVDALDFLLTGRISRLTGSGTGGITLRRHGKHIDCELREAVVRAKIQLRDMLQPIEIKRCLAHPDSLEYDEHAWQYLEPVTNLAKQGLHVLTRREILKYITADASTRAEGIQELLSISEIGEQRNTFVRVKNNFDRNRTETKRSVDSIKDAINATIQETSFCKDIILRVVNEKRSILGGNPISVLSPTELKRELSPPTAVSAGQTVDTRQIEKDIQYLIDLTLLQNQELIAKIDKGLRDSIRTTRSDPQLSQDISRLDFTRWGMRLIDESGSCPLCNTPWPPGELHECLRQRVSASEVAEKQEKHIKELSGKISGILKETIAKIQRVNEAVQSVDHKDISSLLEAWLSNLQELLTSLDNAVEQYPDARFSLEQVQRILAPENASEHFENIRSVIKSKSSLATPEQIAWDTLTRLEEHLKSLEKAEKELETNELSYRRADALLNSFEKARDTVLDGLYRDIEGQFISLYQQLHEADEDSFIAKIEPDGAGLNLLVDFYGRGTHPPHALHSEGHQDSMGLCLYLALAEKLTKDVMDLVILDDVVMSVDSGHRRGICRLLKTCFNDRQLFITTHDRTWTNQLRSEGVVNSRRTIELYNWHVETGPQVNYEVDLWERIEKDLLKNDVPSAAARLRRGSEGFFGLVCDAIHGQVTYKLNAQWELGDLLPGAINQYRQLLKRAKISANSWNNREALEMLKEVHSTAEAIFARSEAEKWAVNANVHYNNWINFTEKDFRPVVEAFKDLYTLFVCINVECRSMLRVVTDDRIPIAVRCDCGKVNWNLVERDCPSQHQT